MVRFTVEEQINAPRNVVWAALADFGNIAAWNTGVKASHLTSEHGEGIDATRHCNLQNGMSVEERILAWTSGESLVVGFDRMPAPIKDISASFHLDGDESTRITVEYAYRGKGLMAPMAPLMKPMFRKAMRGLTADLKAHCEAPSD